MQPEIRVQQDQPELQVLLASKVQLVPPGQLVPRAEPGQQDQPELPAPLASKDQLGLQAPLAEPAQQGQPELQAPLA